MALQLDAIAKRQINSNPLRSTTAAVAWADVRVAVWAPAAPDMQLPVGAIDNFGQYRRHALVRASRTEVAVLRGILMPSIMLVKIAGDVAVLCGSYSTHHD